MSPYQKTPIVSFIFCFLLSACSFTSPASVVPPVTLAPATATPEAPKTPTLIPPTEIPASPTAAARIERVEDFANIKIYDISENEKNIAEFNALFANKMTVAQCIELGKEPPVEPIVFDDKTTPAQIFGYRQDPDGLTASVQIAGEIGSSIFFQHAVACDIGGGVYQHNLLWKILVKGEDGHNKLISIITSLDPTADIYTDYSLHLIQKLGSKKIVTFQISLWNKNFVDSGDALLNSVTGKNPVREKLAKYIIDDQTGTVTLNVSQIY